MKTNEITESKFFHLVQIGERFAGPAYNGDFTVFEKVSKSRARVISSPHVRKVDNVEPMAPMYFAWRIASNEAPVKD